MGITNVIIPEFKEGDILEVVGDENIELEVKQLTYRDHKAANNDIFYHYWHGPVYKKMKGSKDQGTLMFLKLTPIDMSIGVRKLEKEKSFCVDYPYVERVYGLYDVKAKKDMNGNGNPVLFKALLCEYIEGNSMYYYYMHDDFRKYGTGIIDRDEEISLFRYYLQLMFAVKFYSEQSYMDTHAHRDLKPDNIIICTKENRVVIVDFDFAHIPDMNTMNLHFETDFTMPSNTECTSVQWDIHTLGWNLLFCLTGENYTRKQKVENDGCFGFPRDFILERAGKYLEKDYEKLISIIKKMIAHPSTANAYTSIDELIYDYKDFLEEYVNDKSELKEVLAGTELLLQAADDEDEGYPVSIRLIPEEGSLLGEELYNFRTYYYSFDDKRGFQKAHLCLQNVYGEIYYLILDGKVETDADKTVFTVKSGDTFWRDNHKVTIDVTDLRDIERLSQGTAKEVKWFLTKLKNRRR